MIYIVSRDAVFSRMLELVFCDEAKVKISTTGNIARGTEVCIWDADSMGLPDKDIPVPYVVISSQDVSDKIPEKTFLQRPFLTKKLVSAVREKIDATSSLGKFLVLDDETMTASCDDVSVTFSKAEYNLLKLLYDSGEEPVSREKASEVFGDGNSNVTEVYICYLRKKLERLPCHARIVTVRGRGYILRKGEFN